MLNGKSSLAAPLTTILLIPLIIGHTCSVWLIHGGVRNNCSGACLLVQGPEDPLLNPEILSYPLKFKIGPAP
jgi:hypothetical protein